MSNRNFVLQRFRLPGQVITPEQMEFEDSGWYFVANVIPESNDPQDGRPFVEYARKGFSGYKFGNAYNSKGKPVCGYKAMYVKP